MIKSNAKVADSENKRKYVVPTLTCLGDVEKITLTGTGTVAELGSGAKTKKP